MSQTNTSHMLISWPMFESWPVLTAFNSPTVAALKFWISQIGLLKGGKVIFQQWIVFSLSVLLLLNITFEEFQSRKNKDYDGQNTSKSLAV